MKWVRRQRFFQWGRLRGRNPLATAAALRNNTDVLRLTFVRGDGYLTLEIC